MRTDSLEQSAITINSFLDGSCGNYDWDDFISISSQIPLIQAVKDYCADSSFRYPTALESEWCNEEGTQKLTLLAKLLHSGSEDEVSRFLEDERKHEL